MKERAMISKPVVYVDLDGVLADLYNYAAVIHDVEHYNHMTVEEWKTFFRDSDAYHLFRDIPAFKNLREIVDMVKKYAGDYVILSSPLDFDREGSIKGKKEWLKKNIPDCTNAVFDHEKFKYATQKDGTPNVLIDDYKGNTIPWKEKGGISIKFQNDEDPVSKIEETLQQVFGK